LLTSPVRSWSLATIENIRRSGSKSGSGRWSHWDEIGWVHYPEIGWSHSDEIRGVQSLEILQSSDVEWTQCAGSGPQVGAVGPPPRGAGRRSGGSRRLLRVRV